MVESPDILVPVTDLESGDAFRELRQGVISKRTKLAELRAQYLPDHPRVKQAEEAVLLMEEDLRREIETQISMREGETEALRAHEQAIEGAIRDMLEEMNRIPRYGGAFSDPAIAASAAAARRTSSSSASSPRAP